MGNCYIYLTTQLTHLMMVTPTSDAQLRESDSYWLDVLYQMVLLSPSLVAALTHRNIYK